MNSILTIISAALLSLAFPKFNFYFFAWIALVPFLISIEKAKTPRSAAFQGLIFGLVFFGVNLSWINILSGYVGYYANFGWFCLILFQSLFFTAFAYISKRIGINLSVWQAFLWAMVEAARGLGIFGIGGGVLAYSQGQFLSLIQIASVLTVYSISFLIVYFNIAVSNILIKKKWGSLGLAMILVFSAVYFGNSELGKTPKHGKLVKIAVIQGNIPQERKLVADYNQENFNIHRDLTLQASAGKPDIIIWPETAVFTYLLHDNYYLNQIKELARSTNSYLLVGTPHYDEKLKFYNSIAAFSPNGDIIGRYDKQHLVPFGEYLPLKPLTYQFLKNTHFFGNDFSPGPRSAPLNISGIKFGAVICFESTFPQLVKQRSRQGSDILLVATNDGWFKNTSAAYEHFDQAIFRAVENRKYFIQAANTGISAVIDPYGRIIKKLDLNKRGYLTFKIPLT